jgi:hypothetical protein
MMYRFKSYMANMQSEKAETFCWGPKHSHEADCKVTCLDDDVFYVNKTVLEAASAVFLQKLKTRSVCTFHEQYTAQVNENVFHLENKAETVNDFLTIIYPDRRTGLFDQPLAFNARVRIEALIPMATEHLNGGMLESIRHWTCAHPKLSTLATYESTAGTWDWGDDVIRTVWRETQWVEAIYDYRGKKKSCKEHAEEQKERRTEKEAKKKQKKENGLLLEKLSQQTLTRLILIEFLDC